MASITSANAVLTIIVPGLYPVPQIIQGFATDDAFAVDSVDIAETMIGVDGRMSAGFTPFLSKMAISLQADSPSIALFDFWGGTMKVSKDIFFASGTLLLNSTGRAYAMTKGALTGFKPLPDGKKVLQPQTYVITWEQINPALL